MNLYWNAGDYFQQQDYHEMFGSMTLATWLVTEYSSEIVAGLEGSNQWDWTLGCIFWSIQLLKTDSGPSHPNISAAATVNVTDQDNCSVKDWRWKENGQHFIENKPPLKELAKRAPKIWITPQITLVSRRPRNYTSVTSLMSHTSLP